MGRVLRQRHRGCVGNSARQRDHHRRGRREGHLRYPSGFDGCHRRPVLHGLLQIDDRVLRRQRRGRRGDVRADPPRPRAVDDGRDRVPCRLLRHHADHPQQERLPLRVQCQPRDPDGLRPRVVGVGAVVEQADPREGDRRAVRGAHSRCGSRGRRRAPHRQARLHLSRRRALRPSQGASPRSVGHPHRREGGRPRRHRNDRRPRCARLFEDRGGDQGREEEGQGSRLQTGQAQGRGRLACRVRDHPL